MTRIHSTVLIAFAALLVSACSKGDSKKKPAEPPVTPTEPVAQTPATPEPPTPTPTPTTALDAGAEDPAAEPTPVPEPKAEPKVDPKPTPKADPKPTPKAEPKAEPKPEPKAEPKPEPKAEPKPEPKAEPKPVPKPSGKVTAEAQAAWKKNCAKCHGAGGKGDTKMGEKMAIADMTAAAWQKKFSDKQILAATLGGVKRTDGDVKKSMKGYKSVLTPAELDGMVPLMRSFGK